MQKRNDVAALVLCAGKGERSGLGYNKVLHYFGKKTALEHCLDAMLEAEIEQLVVVAAKNDVAEIAKLLSQDPRYCNVLVCVGGRTRTASAKRGIEKAADSFEHCKVLLIHDGARPFVDLGTIKRCVLSAQSKGSGVCALPVVDTIKEAENGLVQRTLKRQNLFCVQTPQAFDFEALQSAYKNVGDEDDFLDDAQVFERFGGNVFLVEGNPANQKITTKHQLLLTSANEGLRAGTGFDVHRLEKNRDLILGGQKIPHTMGLLGHSDADVLVHAIIDAIFSAADERDIGFHFPDTDSAFLGISSMELLAKASQTMQSKGFCLVNVSAVIMCQSPKLAQFIPNMKSNIAAVLGVEQDCVSISATTTEGLGIVGEQKGIAASAFCLLRARTNR